MTDFRDRRLLPHDASLADDPAADQSRTFFPTETGYDITRGLVARSGHPEVGMLVDRYVTDGRCETCQLTPWQTPQESHPYAAVVDRVPGVHSSVDDGRVHNYDPALDAPGEARVVVDDDPTAEARFNVSANRQRGRDDQRSVAVQPRLF